MLFHLQLQYVKNNLNYFCLTNFNHPLNYNIYFINTFISINSGSIRILMKNSKSHHYLKVHHPHLSRQIIHPQFHYHHQVIYLQNPMGNLMDLQILYQNLNHFLILPSRFHVEYFKHLPIFSLNFLFLSKHYLFELRLEDHCQSL